MVASSKPSSGEQALPKPSPVEKEASAPELFQNLSLDLSSLLEKSGTNLEKGDANTVSNKLTPLFPVVAEVAATIPVQQPASVVSTQVPYSQLLNALPLPGSNAETQVVLSNKSRFGQPSPEIVASAVRLRIQQAQREMDGSKFDKRSDITMWKQLQDAHALQQDEHARSTQRFFDTVATILEADTCSKTVLAETLRGLSRRQLENHDLSKGSYRMQDIDGDPGVYDGPINSNGQAHGRGQLQYDRGLIFVGSFLCGFMEEGAVYNAVGVVCFTMMAGSWTVMVVDEVMHKFPFSLVQAHVGSYRMKDLGGHQGVFTGFVDDKGEAHGRGQLQYDHNYTFVGNFWHGALDEGAGFDDGGAIRFTMLSGQWTRGIDHGIMQKFPLDQAIGSKFSGVLKGHREVKRSTRCCIIC